jgi:hypothetical protein
MKLSFWDILASMVMLAGLALATIFINIFINPYTFINPFPPPTPVNRLNVPTLTPSPGSLPELWTATPETPDYLITKSITPSETVTQTGTRLVLPTGTATRTRTPSPSPSKSVTNTPNRTWTSIAYRTSTATAVDFTSTPVTPTSTQVPCSPTLGYCDDNNPSVFYTGSWDLFSGSGPYNSTNHYSSSPGATASFAFNGTKITYLFPTYLGRGHAKITIDGSDVAIISLYSSSLLWQQMWDSATLTNSGHIITITVLDGTIDLDAFIVGRVGPALTPASPTISTNAASGITSTGATLNGTVFSNNASTTVTFQYGLTTAYGTIVTATGSPVNSNTITNVTAAISGLTPGTTYHYRAVGVNTAGTTNGSDLTFTTLKADQAALVIVDPSPVVYGTTPTLTTTGGSGTGTVTYSAGASTGCSVSGTTLTVINVSGTCSITATKAADTNYNSVTSAAQTVTLQKANQTALVVVDPGTVVYGTTPTLSITGGSGTGAVTFSHGASTDCSVAGTTLTVINVGPSCDITATKAADTNYNIATSVARTVVLAKASQTISFTGPGTGAISGTYTPAGSATSGLTVDFSIDPSTSTICHITAGVVTYDLAGTCKINADQGGDVNYDAAPTVLQSVAVS